MGSQQLLLLVAGTIIVGVALVVGVLMFETHHKASSQDAVISDLNMLGADAYAFRKTPAVMGGGNSSYVGYAISPIGSWGTNNDNAVFTVTAQSTNSISFLATSKAVVGATVTITFDADGKVTAGPTPSGF